MLDCQVAFCIVFSYKPLGYLLHIVLFSFILLLTVGLNDLKGLFQTI